MRRLSEYHWSLFIINLIEIIFVWIKAFIHYNSFLLLAGLHVSSLHFYYIGFFHFKNSEMDVEVSKRWGQNFYTTHIALVQK